MISCPYFCENSLELNLAKSRLVTDTKQTWKQFSLLGFGEESCWFNRCSNALGIFLYGWVGKHQIFLTNIQMQPLLASTERPFKLSKNQKHIFMVELKNKSVKANFNPITTIEDTKNFWGRMALGLTLASTNFFHMSQ